MPARDVMRAPIPLGTAGIFSRAAKGETSFTTTGTFTFIVPANVRFISAVCISAGGNPSGVIGGGGGGLAWRNRIPVTPGETLTVVNTQQLGFTPGMTVIRRGSTGDILVGAVSAVGNSPGVPLVGQGGSGGLPFSSGGGGAGGYGGGGSTNAQDASGGAAAGGGTFGNYSGGGGGTGLNGLTTAWGLATGGTSNAGGGAGVGGNAGVIGSCTGCVCPPTCYWQGGNGGNYGGGGGYGGNNGGAGGSGAVRIIWPGETRQFPYKAT